MQIEVSIIIPTYNRKNSLLRTLNGLSDQTYITECFEVIVVDDGGQDGTRSAVERQYPFKLKYFCQSNQGATAARNNGAELSKGEILLFMDDDIVPEDSALQAAVASMARRENTIVLGTLYTPSSLLQTSVFARTMASKSRSQTTEGYVGFQECLTGFLAVAKNDFYQVGAFRDLTGGWPNWDDLEFGYRASRAGYKLFRCGSAIAEHWDYSVMDLDVSCNRWYRAGKSAPRLFQKCPGLINKIPMFRDKDPINWRNDPPTLIGRKVARMFASSRPVIWTMEKSIPPLERRVPKSKLLALLYRWTISGYIYHGYQEGLRESLSSLDHG